jgi:hypothetical protein
VAAVTQGITTVAVAAAVAVGKNIILNKRPALINGPFI